MPTNENAQFDSPGESKSPSRDKRRPSPRVVGLGASAGGLEALQAFFAAVPENSGLAYVVVAHLDPGHTSLLPDLLQKQTKLPVHQIRENQPVQTDMVFIIPPNRDLTIRDGILELTEIAQPRGTRMPIDMFFRSLALDLGERAVGIVLSGTGTDGTLGLKVIKGEAGMVMVQDEKSAGYTGMPRSATMSLLPDYILEPSRMPEQLLRYVRHSTRKPLGESAVTADRPPDILNQIFGHLMASTGHDFSHYKQNTIYRRIERRMAVHQIEEIGEYARYLEESEREVDILFKELLIGVTEFFRDTAAFEVLDEKILPELMRDKPDDYAFRIWVPGCSSGEEAYSIAILLSECMERIGRNFPIQIFGTDIDTGAIDIARVGIYPESILADVGPERLERHFVEDEPHRFRIKKSIREMLVFAPQNLIKDPPFTKLDLLCCRNLLIYLDNQLQKELFPVFRYSLKPGGLLFLGSSESIGTATDLFTAVEKRWKIFRRQPGETAPPLQPGVPGLMISRDRPKPALPVAMADVTRYDVLPLVEAILKQSDTPPCAIIDSSASIIYIHGRMGRFLEPAEGRASVNILQMARIGLRATLAAAIRNVTLHMQEVVHKNIRFHDGSEERQIDVLVRPLLEESPVHGLLMVVFGESSGIDDTEEAVPSPRSTKTVEQLEAELQQTRQHLQTTIEELEASNEELKSTNEELQSTNEELQSTNEEMETSKEELQSLNEESATVNVELQSRIDELSQANDDIRNLLDSTEIATVFLDIDLNVRRYTTRTTDIIPLTGADVGRPLEHFATSLVNTDLISLAKQVLRDLGMIEIEVTSTNGRFYLLRGRPYRTNNNVIDGVVMTFEDRTDRQEERQKIQDSERMFRGLVENMDELVIVIDAQGTIEYANRSTPFLTRTHVPGARCSDLVPAKMRETFIHALQQAVATGETVVIEHNADGSTDATYRLVPIESDETVDRIFIIASGLDN